jgi:hypothetical protein
MPSGELKGTTLKLTTGQEVTDGHSLSSNRVMAPILVRSHFCSMIFGQVMAKIRHGGGSGMVAFRPFSEVVRCGVFGGDKRVKSY